MGRLVLGPLLRYATGDEALVWVECDAPCEVEVRPEGLPAARARTFAVEGHHYAFVHVTGLPEGAPLPYAVALDGEPAWPEAGSAQPAPVLRTSRPADRVRIAFGSCRVTAPHAPPHSLRKDDDPDGREVDALRGLAQRMAANPPDEWPHALVLLGDQVYADEVSPGVAAAIEARRDPDVPPWDTVADFEEYALLYREAWSEPWIRWLLATVPSAMIFDDHDVHDDWNTSADWVRAMRARGWWDRRITGAFTSYLLYQHWGNLPPGELAEDELFQAVTEAGDGTSLLRRFAFEADREVEGKRWSYCRDIGPARLVMVDSRAGRVLDPGARSMVDGDEWQWITEHARGDVEHLLVGTSLPLVLTPALHHLEAWNEAVCDGAWGRAAARVGEELRQALDLEHWSAFHRSFTAMCELLREVGAGRRGRAPATITVLSGDVHHSYLAELGFPRGSEVASTVWQAVSSPLRNPLDDRERRAMRVAFSRAGTALGRALARAAGVEDPPVRWRFADGAPFFHNGVGWIDLDGPRASVTLERAVPDERDDDVRLEVVFSQRLDPGAGAQAGAAGSDGAGRTHDAHRAFSRA